MSKDLYIAAHEDLIDEYLETHPDASWSRAYEVTADAAYTRMADRMADMADYFNDSLRDR